MHKQLILVYVGNVNTAMVPHSEYPCTINRLLYKYLDTATRSLEIFRC